MALRRYASAGLLFVLTFGCSDSSKPPPAPTTVAPASGCKVGETPLDDGKCRPAGVQANGCLAGEVALPQGGCRPAGIAKGTCVPGFTEDAAGGCTATLPAASCASGTFALMGDTSCREIASCGTSTWGNIPTSGKTEFVDAAYAGGSNDGSAAHPWTTIQKAVDVAPSGAVIAIAAGSYVEDVRVAKPLHLWGRCPKMVEVVGTAGGAAIVMSDVTGLGVHNLAVRGATGGVRVVVAHEVALDGLWLHDLAGAGVIVGRRVTELALNGSLIERTHAAGVSVDAAEASITETVIRDIEPAGARTEDAQGIVVRDEAGTGDTAVRSNVTVKKSLIERAHVAGIQFAGSDGVVEGVLVRDMLPEARDGITGRGIRVREGEVSKKRSNVRIASSVVERCLDTAISVGTSDAVIDSVVIRDTRSDTEIDAGQLAGAGIGIQNGAVATVSSVLIERSAYIGMYVIAARATAEGIVVRDSGLAGFGIQHSLTTFEPATGVLRSSVIERSKKVGVVLASPDAAVEGCVVRGHPEPVNGLGIHLQGGRGYQTRGSVTATVVENTHGSAISFQGAQGTIEGCVVRDVQAIPTPPPDDGYASGINIRYDPFVKARSNGTVRNCVIEDSHHAGIDVRASDASITNTVVRRTKKSALTSHFGDGILVQMDIALPNELTSAQISGCSIEGSDRGGIASFGASVVLDKNTLQCNRFALDGELVGQANASFQDEGGNTCSCGASTEPCKVLSSNLEPPKPFDLDIH